MPKNIHVVPPKYRSINPAFYKYKWIALNEIKLPQNDG